LTVAHKYNHIYLIGFMGSGKSFLGESLAQKLGLVYVDTDQLIEEQTGLKIADIFKEKGESAFRDLESAVLPGLSNDNRSLVIATGGGMPCFNDNMDLINDAGLSIYLKWPVSVLVERLKKSDSRPLVSENQSDLNEYVGKLLKERSGYYDRASVIVDSPTVEELTALILERQKSLNP